MPPPPDPSKTTAGIVVDPRTLERVVPQSRRKDGSVRKELKIRPGFTPQEDVGRFRSSRQLTSSPAGPRVVPGSNRAAPPPKTGEPPNPFASDQVAKSKSAAKNEKRKEKRREAAGAGGGTGMDRAWDESSDEEDGGLKEAFGATAEGATRAGEQAKETEFPSLGAGSGDAKAASASTSKPATKSGIHESPVTQAYREDSGDTVEIPEGTEPDLTARISSPPTKADVPDTAAALRRPTDQPWRATRSRGPVLPPAENSGASSARHSPAPARGRGGSTPTRGGRAPAAAQNAPAAASAPASEPRVRKEVKVREGGANDVSSLAARVRGLVLENQSSRSGARRSDQKPAEPGK